MTLGERVIYCDRSLLGASSCVYMIVETFRSSSAESED